MGFQSSQQHSEPLTVPLAETKTKMRSTGQQA